VIERLRTIYTDLSELLGITALEIPRILPNPNLGRAPPFGKTPTSAARETAHRRPESRGVLIEKIMRIGPKTPAFWLVPSRLTRRPPRWFNLGFTYRMSGGSA